MNTIFSFDSPFMRFMTKVADLMILNIITLLCCIPIVTIGPALTALNYVSLKIVRNEESRIIKSYFKSFKQNFWQALVIWLILLVFILFFVVDYFILKLSPIEFPKYLKILLLVMALMIGMLFCYVFPILARFSNTTYQTMKNAAIMSVANIPKTVLMLIMYFTPFYVFYSFPKLLPIVFFLGISGPVFLSALLYDKIFKKLEDKITKDTDTDVSCTDTELSDSSDDNEEHRQ